MIYMKYYAWIPTRMKPPNLYMFRVSSANHNFLLLVTHAKCKQIRTISLLPPDVAARIAEQPGTGKLHHHLGLLSREVEGEELRGVYHFIKRYFRIYFFEPYLTPLFFSPV